MNIAFKKEGDNFYIQDEGVLKRINNESYIPASSLQEGLMSSSDKRKLDSLTLLDTSHIPTEDTLAVQKDSNNNLYIPKPLPEVLDADDLAFSKWKYTPRAISGVWRVASHSYDPNNYISYFRGTTPSGFTNSTSHELSVFNAYIERESSSLPMSIIHKYEVSGLTNNTSKIIHLRYSPNHANGKVGIVYSNGSPIIKVIDFNYPNNKITANSYIDISDIQGNTFVVFAYASRWVTWLTQLPIFYLPRAIQKSQLIGNYTEWQSVKDRLVIGSTFYITNINNNKGGMIIKTSNTEWRDSLGNIVSSNNHIIRT